MRRLLRLVCVTALAPRRVQADGARGAARPGAGRRRRSRCSRTGAGCSPTPSPRGRSRPPTSRTACRSRRARWCGCSIPPAPEKTPGGGQVYVTNLNDVSEQGTRAGAADVARGVRDRGAGGAPDGRVVAAGGADHAARRRSLPSDGGAAAAPRPPAAGGPPVVTIYGTSWCGACRAARQYFTEPQDPVRRQGRRDATPTRPASWPPRPPRWGSRPTACPVIDVRGRLLLGFDSARIETLLGEPT